MRSWLWVAPLVFLSVTACKDGGEDGEEVVEELPSTMDLAGTELKTKNWGVLQSFYQYDQDQDGEVDLADGAVQLVGTDFDDPCYIIANDGAPPDGEAGEWIHVRASVGDLPLDAWPEGQTYDADGDGRTVRLAAYRVDAEGGTLFDAGGPFELGSVTLEGNDQYGPVLTIVASLGFIREGVANTPVDPPEMITFNVGGEDVEVCPEPPPE